MPCMHARPLILLGPANAQLRKYKGKNEQYTYDGNDMKRSVAIACKAYEKTYEQQVGELECEHFSSLFPS